MGAYDRGDRFASYSNHGSAVDLLAPGDEVVSLSHLAGEEDFLILMSGTSMAAGHVTGVAALYLAQNPQASPVEVLTALLESGQSGIRGVPSGTTDKTVHAATDDGTAPVTEDKLTPDPLTADPTADDPSADDPSADDGGKGKDKGNG